MKCRPKPIHTKKISIKPPKRGSAGYWLRVIIAGFYFPMMFISVPLTIMLCSWNMKFSWWGLWLVDR